MAGGKPLINRQLPVPQPLCTGEEEFTLSLWPGSCMGGEEDGAFLQHELDVDAGRDLHAGVVVPGFVEVAPAFDQEGVKPFLGGPQSALVPVGTEAQGRQPRPLHFGSIRIEQHRRHTELVVSLTEYRRSNHDV